ncbi:hypothetical protein HYPDE_28658 [Hyphomicrobium denitrificans 1NES1]|uniref:Uncharacterized protein n=1 Tax=Hyphomicrobium denitrificans 1NES1 TaxID=670307 RepID=N0BA45_9HYPH|nr:hypothetical protein HYPDE_28658 [Hyphomicrobium denitrificans 1NES1]
MRHCLIIRPNVSPARIAFDGSATIVLPGCVTALLRSDEVRQQARIAGKARDKSPRRRLTQPQCAFVNGSATLVKHDDNVRTLYPHFTCNSAEHVIAA